MARTDFIAALRAAHASRPAPRLLKTIPIITVHDLLGAVLLDHTGLMPSDLLSGTTVLVHDDRDVVDAVYDVLKRIWPDGIALMRNGSFDDSYDRAISSGVPVVIVLTDRVLFHPIDAVLLADRDIDLGEVGRPSVIAALTQAVTGTAVHLCDAEAAKIGASTLIRCCPLHATGDDCARRLRTWLDHPVPQGVDGHGTDVEIDARPDPGPAARISHDVVRRLSEMTGFGEAAVWGCNLAVDLRDFGAGRLAWADVDKGILLSGPPGGGKTTFARSLALECDVDLVVTVYSDWHQGVGDAVAKTLSKLFDGWRKKAKDGPFILFVDELDSIGARGGNAHNDSWFSTIINTWLAFLDGAVPRDGIVVVAATNHPERIDPALLRPGRLDRHLELPMPDIEALKGIVRAHLGPDAVINETELAEAARAVRGRSPAQVQQFAREARRVARWCKRRVCASDLTDVLALQRGDADHVVERQTAVHESGHAVAIVVLGVDRLTSVDLDACRTRLLRSILSTKAQVEARLTVCLAGRAAEETMLGAPTTGASQDLLDATTLAMELHGTWGFGAMGLVSFSREAALHDRALRDAVRETLDVAYARALDLVREHQGAIDRVAEALVVRRFLDAGEVRALVAGSVPPAAADRRSDPTRTVRPASSKGVT